MDEFGRIIMQKAIVYPDTTIPSEQLEIFCYVLLEEIFNFKVTDIAEITSLFKKVRYATESDAIKFKKWATLLIEMHYEENSNG